MDYKKYLPSEFEYSGNWIRNWFSNMIPCNIVIDGIKYFSVENYYQSMKAIDVNDKIIIQNLSPHKTKHYVKKIPIDINWENKKVDIMKKALNVKFNLPEWKDKLLKTNNDIIIEWNNWGDVFWGVDIKNCKGENMLGKLLMEIRNSLK